MNVLIRGNLLEDIGGDGIKLWGTNGGIIEKNVVRSARARCQDHAAGIWPFACDDTIIQFNEVSGTKGIMDGQAFDSDYQCRRSLFQYNYSFENEGGFMLVCAPGRAVCDGTVIRYNISVHDGLDTARVFHFGGGSTNTHVYNNTIVVGTGRNLPMLLFTDWEGGKPRDARFTNNLFVVAEGSVAKYDFGPGKGHVFENNVFIDSHSDLPEGVKISQEKNVLKGPLDPIPGRESAEHFSLRKEVRLPRGKTVANHGGRDFFGNPVPNGQPPSVGAIEAAGR